MRRLFELVPFLRGGREAVSARHELEDQSASVESTECQDMMTIDSRPITARVG